MYIYIYISLYIYIYIYTCNSKKLYLGLTEREFKKQRFYYHVKSFKSEIYANSIHSQAMYGKRKREKM